MLSRCWLHIKQPPSETWGAERRRDSGYLAGRAPALWVGGGEGTLTSLRDMGSLAPTHGISNGCQKPSLFNGSSQKMPMKGIPGPKSEQNSQGMTRNCMEYVRWASVFSTKAMLEIPPPSED